MHICRGLTPDSSEAPHSCSLAPHPPPREREENLFNYSLIGKGKAVLAGRTKQGIHSPRLMSRPVFSATFRTAGLHHAQGLLENKAHKYWHSQHPPYSIFFPQLWMLSMRPHGIENLFVRGVSCPSCVLSNLLCTPSSLPARLGREAGEALTLCEHCSEVIIES